MRCLVLKLDDISQTEKETVPTDCASHITRLNDLSHGITMWTSLFRFVTNHTFDRQTDR